MLCSASTFSDYAVAASDGRLGGVKDLLFDDRSWSIRWLVLDTGDWLSGRKVLISPPALDRIDSKAHEISFRLTMQQVKDSPPSDTDWPVSRQMEADTYDYYGWTPHWGNTAFTTPDGYADGALGAPPLPWLNLRGGDRAGPHQRNDDPHLRSAEALTGYHIYAIDGEIGHIADFLVEDSDWSIHCLVIDTKNWWPGRRVLISPKLAARIDWMDKRVYLTIDRQNVKDSPAYSALTAVEVTVLAGHVGNSE